MITGALDENEPGDLRAAQAGDLAAFERILIRYERLVLRLALRLLGDPADAEDAAQEVYVRLHRHLGRFDSSREFQPWLYRVTVNVCRDQARRRPRLTEPLDALAAADPAPDEQADAAERRRILAAGIETLTVRERSAVVLRDIEGLTTAEVARILGSTQATVRSHLSNARLKLRDFVLRIGGAGRRPAQRGEA